MAQSAPEIKTELSIVHGSNLLIIQVRISIVNVSNLPE